MAGRKSAAAQMALGGTLAALAVLILAIGTLVPMATFCCPVLACFLLIPVLAACGRKLAWAWYLAVAILGSLLAPDKEAAAVFVFLGYYPIIWAAVNRIRSTPLRWAVKLLYFNASVCVMYAMLIFVLGMESLAAEFSATGPWLLAVTLILGNATFLMLDVLLGRLTALCQRRCWHRK